jgi:hypothetical protein
MIIWPTVAIFRKYDWPGLYDPDVRRNSISGFDEDDVAAGQVFGVYDDLFSVA